MLFGKDKIKKSQNVNDFSLYKCKITAENSFCFEYYG